MKLNKVNVLAVAAIIALASCGGGTQENNEQEKEMTHDEMHESGMEHDGHHHDDAATEEEALLLDIPVGAKVYFGNLTDGQKVTSPVKVEFKVDGMQVEPAGELHENMGHHHIIINGDFLPRGTVVPADSVNIHYGKGQTETTLDLPKGEHTLTLQFADGYHQSYGQQMSNSIKVIVE